MLSYKIHLLRTGSTQDTPDRRYAGQCDLPLCARGREALAQLSQTHCYPPVERVYSSPLLRCVQSAQLLYPARTIQTVDGLMDMNLGSFEGKSFEQLKEDEAFIRWLDHSLDHPPPGGETAQDFTQRILSAFDEVVREMMRERTTSAAVITHGGVIMSLMAAIALPKLPIHKWAVANGCGYTLLTNTQLWMQGGCAEAFAYLPGEDRGQKTAARPE